MPANRPNFQVANGVLFPPFFSRQCFESVFEFQPKEGDIFVVTYPKCGTTWMQNVVVNILRRAKPLDNPRDFFLASPFMDQLGAEDSVKMMIRPGAYKTHLSFEKIPWSNASKYIYVARNPKDCCVSFYHHMLQIPGYQFSEASFEDFFNLFVKGDVEFNDYFDHLLSWYNQRHQPNVFFTTYEEMKKNLKDVVLKVADFIKKDELQYLVDNPEVLDAVIDNCSFGKMKFFNDALNMMYDNVDDLLADPNVPRGRKHMVLYNSKLPARKKERINFIRKGEIGGWKTVFTSEQNVRMDERIRAMTKSCDVMELWKDVL